MNKKRLLIICEGQTEKEFINRILRPYILCRAPNFERVDCFEITTTRGGLTKYSDLNKDIINCIYQSDIVVSTLIDFYGLPTSFPKYSESSKIANKCERVDYLEQAILEDISKTQEGDFNKILIPYIQLHEFEALIFSSIEAIKNSFELESMDLRKIQEMITNPPNPETINDGPDSAPSKRLKKLIRGYDKVNDGNNILEDIGIEHILEKCPRFASWVNKLIDTA